MNAHITTGFVTRTLVLSVNAHIMTGFVTRTLVLSVNALRQGMLCD